MAKALGHKWGQVIGDLLEAANKRFLEDVAKKYHFYLDSKGDRPARDGKKVSWQDKFGNTHDLDYVFERGGSDTKRGLPVAFIESAWRRYTKHSRNKAQEIEGAIGPLSETFQNYHPFLGVIVAGEFTAGSLKQLRSKGFVVLYFSYDSVVQAFASVGIDASFKEKTTDKEFKEKLRAWKALPLKDQEHIIKVLFMLEEKHVQAFEEAMHASFSRGIEGVTFIALRGKTFHAVTIKEAINLLTQYEEGSNDSVPFVRYEIEVRYSNGDKVHANFQGKGDALQFLALFQ
jgi:hypothetical protein